MPLIAVDGIDACGKSSVIDLLAPLFQERFEKVHVIHCPTYDSPTGKLLRELLQKPPDDQFYFSLLFEVNRRENLETLKLGTNRSDMVMVLCDRYYMSGMAYALARKMISFQYQIIADLSKTVPQPHLSFILDISPSAAADRMSFKSRDELENNIDFQTRVRRNFLNLAQYNNWIVVNANRPKEEVVDVIFKRILDEVRYL